MNKAISSISAPAIIEPKTIDSLAPLPGLLSLLIFIAATPAIEKSKIHPPATSDAANVNKAPIPRRI